MKNLIHGNFSKHHRILRLHKMPIAGFRKFNFEDYTKTQKFPLGWNSLRLFKICKYQRGWNFESFKGYLRLLRWLRFEILAMKQAFSNVKGAITNITNSCQEEKKKKILSFLVSSKK